MLRIAGYTQGGDKCCWIDVKTGKTVATAPLSGINIAGITDGYPAGSPEQPGIAMVSDDRRTAYNRKTGENFAKRPDGCWIDVKTGKKVASVPLSGINIAGITDGYPADSPQQPGIAMVSDDRRTAYNRKTGQNFARISCDRPKTAGKIGWSNNQTNLFLGYAYANAPDAPVGNLHGFNASVFHNVTGNVALGGEVSGAFGSDHIRVGTADANVKVTRYTYLFGSQFSTCPNDNVRLFGHTLIGGAHDSSKTTLGTATTDFSANAFAMGFGGGVDVRLNRRFSFRAVQADYIPTRFGGSWQNNFRLSTGLVLRFGNK